MKYIAIPEGVTEEKVLRSLIEPNSFTILKGEGKSKIRAKIVALYPDVANGLRCLVLRDVDEGETLDQIVQSVADACTHLLSKSGYPTLQTIFTPHETYTNIYSCVFPTPDVRFTLHIAGKKWHDNFTKSTIDDYILDLALQKSVVGKMISGNGVEWASVRSDEIVRKVIKEVPALLTRNQIPLHEAKDYIRLYAAIMQLHTSPPIFADVVLGKAEPTQKAHVFGSLLAAIAFLRG